MRAATSGTGEGSNQAGSEAPPVSHVGRRVRLHFAHKDTRATAWYSGTVVPGGRGHNELIQLDKVVTLEGQSQEISYDLEAGLRCGTLRWEERTGSLEVADMACEQKLQEAFGRRRRHHREAQFLVAVVVVCLIVLIVLVLIRENG